MRSLQMERASWVTHRRTESSVAPFPSRISWACALVTSRTSSSLHPVVRCRQRLEQSLFPGVRLSPSSMGTNRNRFWPGMSSNDTRTWICFIRSTQGKSGLFARRHVGPWLRSQSSADVDYILIYELRFQPPSEQL